MLRSFDFLGMMKWPNLLAVTALPIISFAFWGGFDDPVPMRNYGRTQAGMVSVEFGHPVASDPRIGDTRWCARPCPDCGPRIARAEVTYGGKVLPERTWTALSQDALDLCTELPKATGSRVWLRLTSKSGEAAVSTWPIP